MCSGVIADCYCVSIRFTPASCPYAMLFQDVAHKQQSLPSV